MPRYNRDDYSACDWRATKSDILRNKLDVSKKRKISLVSALFFMVMSAVIIATLAEILKWTT